MTTNRLPVNGATGPARAAALVTSACPGGEGNKYDLMQIQLLTEETLSLAAAVTQEYAGDIWFVQDGRRWEIHLDAIAQLNLAKKEQLLANSKSGKNVAAKGFIGAVSSFVSDMIYHWGDGEANTGYLGMVTPETTNVADIAPVWTLTQYKQDIVTSADDLRLDELEQSILANLSDDIQVGVKKDRFTITVIRDFAGGMSGSVTTRVHAINHDTQPSLARAITAYYARKTGLKPKDALRLNLLVEETMGMMRALTSGFSGELWLTGDGASCAIHLNVTAQASKDQREALISAATSGKNSAHVGFMAHIGRMIASAFSTGGEGGEYAQIDEFDMDDMWQPYKLMGTLRAMEATPIWSLSGVRERVWDSKAPAAAKVKDELEKSIVASLASDVTVSMAGDTVEMTITEDFSK